MRPLKITMQAFGPYAQKETIDFTVLGNRTMFVISGKTGSGKTTIFDAISYAIYGKASGEDRNGPELRSQFAPPSLLTEVSFEFKLKEKRYLITRSPQQEKKKERGDGTTTIGAKAELYSFNEEGEQEIIASSIRDVEEKIKEIIQIDSNQFRQILMIPQGEFRKLLTSDSKEKENILQRLFHTEMYKRIEERLKDQAQNLKKTVEQKVLVRNNALSNISSLFTEELTELIEQSSDNDVVILPLLEKEIQKMENEISIKENNLVQQNVERDNLKKRLYEAEVVLKQMNMKDELQNRLNQLKNQENDYKDLEEKIELAQKAAILAQQEEICHHLKRQIDQGELEKKQITTSLSQWQEKLAHAEEQYNIQKDKEKDRKQIADKITWLKNMEQDVRKYAKLEEQLAHTNSELKSYSKKEKVLMEERREFEVKVMTFKEKKKDLENQREQFLQLKEKISDLTIFLDKLKEYERAGTKWAKVSEEAISKQKEMEKVSQRYQDAKDVVEKVEEKWLTNQSYFLALQLKKNEACPVCGSTHHPEPASIQENVHGVSEEDRKSAKADLTKMEQEKASIERKWFEVKSQATVLEQDVNERLVKIKALDTSFTHENSSIIINTIEDQLKQCNKEKAQIEENIKELVPISNRIESIEAHLVTSLEQLDELRKKIQSLTIHFTEYNTTLQKMKDSIPEELRNIEHYNKTCNDSKKTLEEMEQIWEKTQNHLLFTKEKMQSESIRLESMERQVVQLKESLEKERDIFLDRMSNQGFSTYRDYANSKRPDHEIDQFKKNLQGYKEECRSIIDRLNELQQGLQGVEIPKIEELNESLAAITEKINTLQQEMTNLLLMLKENKGIYHQVTTINLEVKKLEEQYKLVGHLYDISRGQNVQRITFERYVLASFLDDILLEANTRLSKMTSGRYMLLRKSDRSKGNVQSGLELLVFDQYTGQERHVKTLSGGESFKASLSLALGLADVVQQHAGGISLETMFIDEGFGTLDPESLDQAIETLMDIQSSGRLVGVISHVPELKDRMEVRLEVIASQTGSTTRFEYLS